MTYCNKREKQKERNYILYNNVKKVNKGVWWMPRLSEAKKDVTSCDKLRGGANSL